MTLDARSSSIICPAPRREPLDALTVFVIHAHAVAQATDPMLAGLLAGILGAERSGDPGAAWSGDRREGLELCRRLLLYVRPEAADRRIDVSLGYIASELAAIGAPQPEARLAH